MAGGDEMIKHSARLEELLGTRTDAGFDKADETCTAGHNCDGSTGVEIFEHGFDLALKVAGTGKTAFYGVAGCDAGCAFFVVATDEDEACAIVEAWDVDVD
jgi:hypothetical protein